ncbi:hypothetical protein [Chryseobacterium sp. HSC-36S06]|uniref:hypothetical protein n=1 Tax=Chryseobacterium sp. HSC-36S06 TaxID=2910970 RepID=UPI0020A1E61F|nr:hypothetical protein [Chryseobacterium sp. HSC-36S06]MCP2038165.1 hypothetical protein [Chryseobacterium sp. HSC-36S06]
MEYVLLTFCRFDFYIIKVTAHTKNYIEFYSLYPLKGISADYYAEDEDFFDDTSIQEINKFVSGVMEVYLSFFRTANFFVKYIKENLESNDPSHLKHLSANYMSDHAQFIDFIYLSNATQNNLIEMGVNYYLNIVLPFENNFKMEDRWTMGENCMKRVLEQNIDKVFSFPYSDDDIFGGIYLSKKINLSGEHFPEELLLQEIIICINSTPDLNKDENPFHFEYLEERFNSFSDYKKLQLFLFCSKNQELFMFDRCLDKWWMNRY